MERMLKRARHEELQIQLGYLSEIHGLHEEWLAREPHTLVIDGEQEFESRPERAREMVAGVREFLRL